MALTLVLGANAATWPGFARGMGIGGWLTNYKRFNVLPEERRLPITPGDLEHFDSYITEADVKRIKGWGFDHIRLGFDQIVLEESPGRYRERTFRKIDDFIGWCGKHRINVVLNLHKAIGNYCDIKETVELLDDDGLQRRFIDLWLEIERRYHDFPGLAFEILNEVRDVDPTKWNNLADRTLQAIRAKNPDRWVVVGSTPTGLRTSRCGMTRRLSILSTCTRRSSSRTSAAYCSLNRSTATWSWSIRARMWSGTACAGASAGTSGMPIRGLKPSIGNSCCGPCRVR